MIWKIIFDGNLILLSLDHLVTGFMGVFYPKRAVALYQRLFGVHIELSEAITLLLKPWGALGIFAACATIYPIIDPERYIGVLVALLILLLIRIYIRMHNRSSGSAHLGLSKQRNHFHVGLIVLCAALIAIQIVMILF